MRLFIAIGLPADIRAAFDRDNRKLRRSCSRGSFSREENLHLTLCFLGETPPERVSAVTRAMDSVSSLPIALTIGDPGIFRSREGGTLWRSVDGGPALLKLQSALSDALAGDGFAMESRKYTPHLTAARRVVLREGVSVRALAEGCTPLSFTAREITLFLSEQKNGVRVYTPLYRKALSGAGD